MITMHAKMKDGSPVVIHHEDMGDVVPGFDADGNRYDTYTSKFWSDKFPVTYSQLSKTFINSAKSKGESLVEIRMAEDMAVLESAGVDTATIDYA